MSQYFGGLIMQQVVFVYNLLYLAGFELEWIDSEFTEQQPATRPNCSYSCMISMALNSSIAQRLHLSKIIRFIEYAVRILSFFSLQIYTYPYTLSTEGRDSRTTVPTVETGRHVYSMKRSFWFF